MHDNAGNDVERRDTITLRARVAAPVAEVRRALTDPTAMRIWLAEHAEVDLPHRYEFWGRSTLEGDAPHQRPLHVDHTTVRFAWLLDGQDTTVAIGLAEQNPDTTVITLSQSHYPGWEVALGESNVRGFLHTYWALQIANLVDYLEGREPTARCDLTSPVMRGEWRIAGSPAELFDSLVNPEKFSRWFGARMEIEPRVGGRFAMGGFDLDPEPAELVAFEPGRRLGLRWPSGLCTEWELAESGGATRLTIVQSGFADTRPPYGGWMGNLAAIAALRRFHELPNWRSIWLEVDSPGVPEGMLTVGH
jgi:uncharacterized protein YndB with AHSA1/START domain